MVSYTLGGRLLLLSKVPFISDWEAISFSVSLGMGLISYIVFFTGLAGLLDFYVIGTVLLLLITLTMIDSISLYNKRTKGYLKRSLKSKLLPIALIALLFIPVFILTLYPPTAWDATMNHLALVRAHLDAGRLTVNEHLRFAVFPQLMEMLFSIMMLFFDDISTHLISFSMMSASAITLYAFSKRYYSQRAGLWAAALFLSNPYVLWLGSTAYVDSGLILFVTVSTYALFNWYYSKEKHWLILAALFTGFAAGVKYSGLFFVLLFSVVVFFISCREKKYRTFPLFFVSLLLAASPYYIFNLYYTGNPVWPFWSDLFGYSIWNQVDLESLLRELASHGTGTSLVSFLTLPWNLTFRSKLFLVEVRPSLSYFLLFSFPFVVLTIFRKKMIRNLFLLIISYTLFWFFSGAQELRYLLPVLPLYCMVTAVSIETFLMNASPLKKFLQNRGVMAIMLFMLLQGWFYSVKTIYRYGFPPVTEAKRTEYLSKRLPTYKAYYFLNSIANRKSVLYALNDMRMAYFYKGDFRGDIFGPYRYSRILDKLDNEERLYKELKAMDADYFLINIKSFKGFKQNWLEWEYIRPIFINENAVLYGIFDENEKGQGSSPPMN